MGTCEIKFCYVNRLVFIFLASFSRKTCFFITNFRRTDENFLFRIDVH